MCELCHKKCKSKSGLKRHKTVKHKETSEVAENQKGGGQESCLTLVAYSRIVEKAKHKIIDNKIYPKSIRDELSSYTYNNGLQDLTAGFCDIEDLYKRLMKSGNAERFYSSFYSTIALNAVKHFEGLSRNTATLWRSKELRLVEENHATVKSDSSVAPRGMKTCCESRIELLNLQILKNMLEKSSQFLSSEQPCEPKSLDAALKIAGVEKIPSENLWLRST